MPKITGRLPTESVDALRDALQAAVKVAVRTDPRDQTAHCLIGAHMLGLWPSDSAVMPPLPETLERVREISFVATAALNTAAGMASPPSDLIRFVGSAILGSTPQLCFYELGWGASEYAILAAVLPGCVALEELTIAGMTLNDADAAAIVEALPLGVKSLSLSCAGLRRCPDLSTLPTLCVLSLGGCPDLEEPPDVSSLTFLERLDLFGCTSLEASPDVSALQYIQIVNLAGCTKLAGLPDVSAPRRQGSLRALVAPTHLKEEEEA